MGEHPLVAVMALQRRARHSDCLSEAANAVRQILRALPRMNRAASSRELRKPLSGHERVTRRQVRRLERIDNDLDDIPSDDLSSHAVS